MKHNLKKADLSTKL